MATKSCWPPRRKASRRLNQRYGPAPGGDRFLLLHRRRVWNEGEGCWIGWERKRGKLCELNRLLRGAEDTTFLAPPAVPDERPLRDHARCGHAAAARDGRAAHRQDGASPQPAALGRRSGSSRRRLRHPAAAGHAGAAGGARRLALPARVLQRHRHRSLRRRGLGRVPGPLRRRLLYGQGHLRRGRLRGGVGRTRARVNAPQP